MIKLIALLGWGLLLTAGAQGRTITVAASGADYTTIAAAVGAANAGDVVEVQSGTYGESISSVRAGSAGSLITIKSVPRRMAKINGVSVKHNYVKVEGFECSSGVGVNASYVEIVDNYVNGYSGTAFSLDGRPPYPNNHVTFRNNHAYRCQYGVVIQGDDVLFEGNEIERMVQHNPSGDSDYCRVFGVRVTIRGNYFHGSVVEEIGTAHLDIVQFFTNNNDYVRDLLIEKNIFCDAHQGIMAENFQATDCRNIMVYNNIYNRMWAFGILAVEVGTFKVYNNLFANTLAWGVDFSQQNSQNNEVYNNIFFFARENSYLAENGADVTGDYNLTWVSFNPPNPGPHDLLVKNPMFVDFRTDDFHLTDVSLCIDNGCDKGLTTDLEGNPRPVGNGFDIGPYEYQGASGLKGAAFGNPYFEKYRNSLLPNPLKAGMVNTVTFEQGLSWYSLDGQRLSLDDITDGVYLVNSLLAPGLRKIAVIE
jgi:hypothetical protein